MDRLNRDFRGAIDFESIEYDNNSPDQRLIERQRGLTTEQINSIPIVKITKDNANEYKDKTCTICLNDFTTREKIKVFNCQHPFHEK